jgi:hypothetical protein
MEQVLSVQHGINCRREERQISECPSGNFCLKALEEIRHGLPNKRLSGTSFNFLIWKNESNQTHVSGQTLSLETP